MREITQVHYSSWPDFGAPASPSQVLALVELSNRMQRAAVAPTMSSRSEDPEGDDGRPMLVHCSAGCGRTGTFCTIDSVIDMLKRQRKEVKAGVTPMEVASTSSSDPSSFFGGDYLGKGHANASTNTNTSTGTVQGDWIWDQDLDLVEHTVAELRGQRLSMVQSLRQFVLCYETVLEWIALQSAGGERGSPVGGNAVGSAVERGGRERSGSTS